MPLPAEPYFYGAFRAWDVAASRPVGGAVITFHSEADTSYATPIEVWDPVTGNSLGTSLTSSSVGDVGTFVLAVSRAVAKSGDWVSPLVSTSGIEEAVTDARDAALAAQAAAEAAAAAGGGGGGSGILGAPSSWPDTFPPSGHSHTVGDLRKSDGSSLAGATTNALNATDAQAFRAAIGAGTGNGTSNLTLGDTATTAAPGNHLHGQYLTDPQVQSKIDAAISTAGTAPSGTMIMRRYASGAYPVRGTLPTGAVAVWAGPVAPPVGGSYFVEGTDIWLATAA